MNIIPGNLVVLEMANNHMGDVEHGLAIIREFGKVCRATEGFSFAFKLQYRDLNTFIHPAAQGRNDIKYIKRFSETRLIHADFDRLVAEMRANGFLTMATPFDEPSVEVIEGQGLDVIKIASCSFTDWPLLERVVRCKQPVIASTAGASVEDMDRVVSFLMHRNKEFAIMHCVGEYPTAEQDMHLSQIDFLKQRYPGVRIGFSSHEEPGNTDIIKLALAKGADLFEKHVGLPTQAYPLNNYSVSPEQMFAWLTEATRALRMCGVGDARLPVNTRELASLRSLRRGVFARRPIAAGAVVKPDDTYFAFPPAEGQYTANDWSKYALYTATADILADAPITPNNTIREDRRAKIWEIAQRVKSMLEEARIIVPGSADLEISHHYGLDEFEHTGLVLITVVNRGYCKKLLVSLPGQMHPEQYHNIKEETFHVLRGEVNMQLDGQPRVLKAGDVLTVEPGVRHAFVSPTGSIIEEISTTHNPKDSFYIDDRINQNNDRKTLLTYWMV